jgi:hypothetical protein
MGMHMEKKVTIKQVRRKHRLARKQASTTLSLKPFARENAKLIGEPVGKLAR